MKRSGYTSAGMMNLRLAQINSESPQLNGLVSAWLFTAMGNAPFVKDRMLTNHATPTGAWDTNYGWQETDNELGTGVFQDGSGHPNTWDCGNDTSIQVASTGLTICIWVRLYQVLSSSGFPGLLGKGDSDSNPSGSYLMYLAGSPAHVNFFNWSGSARRNAITGATNLDFQSTYHFAATWQPSVRESLYVNGLVDATTTTSVSATLDNPAYNFLIGSNQGGASKTKYAFRGMIHEARVYNRALTPDEIWQLYDPRTRWDLYRSPTRFISYPGASTPAGRVYGPAAQVM